MFFAYLPWGIEYCETDFGLNGGRPVNTPALQRFCESSLLRFDHICIFVKGCLTFFTSVYSIPLTSSINAGVNQTFSVIILLTMIHMVVNEALLFNIFTRALYKIMQHDIFSFLIFH